MVWAHAVVRWCVMLFSLESLGERQEQYVDPELFASLEFLKTERPCKETFLG